MARTGHIVSAIVLLGMMLAVFSPLQPQPVLRINQYSAETVHTACTPAEKRAGLSTFTNLEPGEVMVFLFEEERRVPFWMKDMDFSIDMIWINANHTVTHVEHRVPLCGTNCSFTGQGKYVVETRAGTADRYNITAGDSATIRTTC